MGSPSLTNFPDPGSRPHVFIRQRSAFRTPTEAKRLASFLSSLKKNSRADRPENLLGRKGGDSNPRYDCSYACFPSKYLKPLGHLSVFVRLDCLKNCYPCAFGVSIETHSMLAPSQGAHSATFPL